MRFEVVLTNGTTEVIVGADTYAQEGPLTTFWSLPAGREVPDAWSRRVASIRTAEVRLIRRLGDIAPVATPPAAPAVPTAP